MKRNNSAFEIDGDFRIVSWSDDMRSLLGWTSGQVVGRRCFEVLRGQDREGSPVCGPSCAPMQLYRQGKIHVTDRCQLTAHDGEIVSVRMAGVPASLCATQDRSAVVAVVVWPETATATAAAALRVYALGRFFMTTRDGDTVPTRQWARQQAVAVFKYLFHRRGHLVHREVLMEYLWPNEPPRRTWERLKAVVYFLRNELRQYDAASDVIHTEGESYMLRRDAVWSDVDQFEFLLDEAIAAHGRGQVAAAREHVAAALHFYRGNYLEDHPYDDVFFEERDRLRERHDEAVQMLLRWRC